MNCYLIFFCKDNWFFLHYLFSYSIVYLYQYRLVNIYFILLDKIQCSLIILLHCFSWSHWKHFEAGSCANLRFPIPICSFCSSIFILSGVIRISRFIFYFPCPSPRIIHFSNELWCLLLEYDL